MRGGALLIYPHREKTSCWYRWHRWHQDLFSSTPTFLSIHPSTLEQLLWFSFVCYVGQSIYTISKTSKTSARTVELLQHKCQGIEHKSNGIIPKYNNTCKDLADIIIRKPIFMTSYSSPFWIWTFWIHNRVCMQTVPGESEGILGYPRWTRSVKAAFTSYKALHSPSGRSKTILTVVICPQSGFSTD